jgi:serine-type D-Ala-D-Ala carboxypeptidase (penicillin-binding protein 5/6)
MVTDHKGSSAIPRLLAGAVTLALLTALFWQPASAQERPAPASRSRAAIVIDAETGAVLYERNARTAFAPASLTKMVTALVAIERAPLDRIVRPTHPFDVIPVVIGLEPGDTLTLEDALYGLLLNSGNDAALAIAETAGDGSTEKFVGWMNDLARRLGLQHSHFKNPHGLDQDGHVASAYDMAIIGRALITRCSASTTASTASRPALTTTLVAASSPQPSATAGVLLQ